MATLTQLNGFEHGLATSGTPGVFDTIVGAPAIVTTTPRTGSRCLECSASAATESAAHNAGTPTVFVFGFALYIPTSLPTADQFLAHFVTGGTIDCVLKFRNSDDRLILANHTSGEVVAGPVIAADTWYWIDGRLNVSANPFTCDWAVDEVAQTQWTGAAAATTVTSIHLGWRTATQTLTVRYDDLVFGVTSGDYPLGPHSVVRLMPTSDGTHNTVGANELERTATGTDITDATTDAFSLIDDAPLDVTPTDYVNDVGTSATAYVEVLFENLPGGTDTPVDVKGYQVDRDSTATGTSAAHSGLLLSDNTAVTPDLRVSADDPGTTVTTRKKMLTRPAGDWDRTKVDGLKARLGFGDGAPDVWFASLMLEVAMQPASGDATASPGVIAITTTLPQPAVSVEEASAAIATTVALPQAGAGVGAAPAVLAAVSTLPQPLVGVGAAPAATAAVAALPQATVDTGESGNATATPAAIASIAALPQAAVSAGAAPASIAAIATLPQSAVGIGAALASIAAVVTLPQSAISVGAAPAVIPIVVALPTATVGVLTTVTPDAIVCTVTLPQANPVGAALVTPAAIATVVTFPQASAAVDTTVAPASITAVVAIATPTESVGATPAPIAVTVTLPLVTSAGSGVFNAQVVSTVAAAVASAAAITAGRTSSSAATAGASSTSTVTD